MATRKDTQPSKVSVQVKVKNLNFFGKLYKLDLILLTVALLIWIFVGSFFSLTIVDNLKSLAKQKALDKVGGELNENVAPSEVMLEGIGNVNINCVQSKVKPESVQKAVGDKTISNLPADEKAKLESCIVGLEATPTANPN